MNRLIDGAVQLLNEAAKRKSEPKFLKYGYDGVSELAKFDFDGHDHPHYLEWKKTVEAHPNFGGYQDHRFNTESYDRGMASGGGWVTARHALDTQGRTIAKYVMPHPTGYVHYPDTPNKRKK